MPPEDAGFEGIGDGGAPVVCKLQLTKRQRGRDQELELRQSVKPSRRGLSLATTGAMPGFSALHE